VFPFDYDPAEQCLVVNKKVCKSQVGDRVMYLLFSYGWELNVCGYILLQTIVAGFIEMQVMWRMELVTVSKRRLYAYYSQMDIAPAIALILVTLE
jgi:hypothetical protein